MHLFFVRPLSCSTWIKNACKACHTTNDQFVQWYRRRTTDSNQSHAMESDSHVSFIFPQQPFHEAVLHMYWRSSSTSTKLQLALWTPFLNLLNDTCICNVKVQWSGPVVKPTMSLSLADIKKTTLRLNLQQLLQWSCYMQTIPQRILFQKTRRAKSWAKARLHSTCVQQFYWDRRMGLHGHSWTYSESFV